MSEARQSAAAPPLVLSGLRHSYRSGEGRLEVLRGVEFSVQAGETVALVAPSGTGKSTLLHLAGLLERPQSGSVLLDGRAASAQPDAERTRLRRKFIGFVYQFHHLLAEFTATENVALPQMADGVRRGEARTRAHALLREFGLGHRLSYLPGKLSGGEQQRVAIARALANRPRVLLADEPTGNLDAATADQVFDSLLRVARSESVGCLIATHNAELARRLDRIVTLRDGLVVPLEAVPAGRDRLAG